MIPKHEYLFIDKSGGEIMASIENHSADWQEMRARVDSIANAIFLIGGGSLSLSMSVVISNFESLTVNTKMVSDISSAWLSLVYSIGLALLLKIYMVFQSFHLQGNPEFMNKYNRIFNLGGWIVGGTSFVLFCVGFYLTVIFGVDLVSGDKIVEAYSSVAKSPLSRVGYSDDILTRNPFWLEYVSSLALPMIAVFGLYIAYRQWRTNQNNLKLALFKMRLSIYESSAGYISEIMSGGVVSDKILFDFLAGTSESKWLFNAEINKYLFDDLYSNGVDLQCLRSELEGLAIGNERLINLKNQTKIKKWLLSQISVIDEKFEPYLRLSH